MCKYCTYTIPPESTGVEELLKMEEEPRIEPLYEDYDTTVSVIASTPISRRKNPETPGILQIANMTSGVTIEIPITYCPMCGRKL